MISEHNAYAYCIEDISLIENYEEAVKSPILWQCHHKNEIELNKSAKDLIEMGLYYHRPANELIFLTVSEHSKLHQTNNSNIHNGEHLTDEHKRKISEAHKGKKHSKETKEKISNTIKKKPVRYWKDKNFSEEHRQKLSEANKGHTYNRGRIHTEQARLNMSLGKKGKHRVWNEEHTKYHYE